MKNVIFLTLSLLPLFLMAQQEGTVTYKETVKLDIELPEDSEISQEQLEAMMPDEQVAQKVLYFNESASLYTDPPAADNDNGEFTLNTGDGGQFRIKTVSASGNNKVYHDIKKNSFIDQRDFLGKTFLVQGEVKSYDWKITGETKDIAGYPCQKATAAEEDRTIELWFTPAIPLSTGPNGFMDLPGLILEAHVVGERSDRQLVAQSISFEPLEKDELKAPSKGKKVTEEEFDKIVEEKTKEMSEGGGMRIRIGN